MRDQPNQLEWGPPSAFEWPSWDEVAFLVVCNKVRSIACPEFQTNENPLIDELSKLVKVHHIATGAGSEFPICVLGDVGHFEGKPREAHTTDSGGLGNHGHIHSITVRTPRRKVEKTVRGHHFRERK